MKKIILTFAELPDSLRSFAVETDNAIVITVSESYRENIEAILEAANQNER